jgi:hypothetical protein
MLSPDFPPVADSEKRLNEIRKEVTTVVEQIVQNSQN